MYLWTHLALRFTCLILEMCKIMDAISVFKENQSDMKIIISCISALQQVNNAGIFWYTIFPVGVNKLPSHFVPRAPLSVPFSSPLGRQHWLDQSWQELPTCIGIRALFPHCCWMISYMPRNHYSMKMDFCIEDDKYICQHAWLQNVTHFL